MKKFTIVLLALVLACSCVFAARFSLTAGAGVGSMKMFEKKSFNTDRDNNTAGGPNLLFGFDFATAKGLSAYNDFSLRFDILPVGRYDSKYEQDKQWTLSEVAGAGYTLDFGKVTLMAGAGVDLQWVISKHGLNKPTSSSSSYGLLGINTRLKGTYHFTEHWGMSLQMNNSVDLLKYGKYVEKTEKKNATLSGSAMAGVVFTF